MVNLTPCEFIHCSFIYLFMNLQFWCSVVHAFAWLKVNSVCFSISYNDFDDTLLIQLLLKRWMIWAIYICANHKHIHACREVKFVIKTCWCKCFLLRWILNGKPADAWKKGIYHSYSSISNNAWKVNYHQQRWLTWLFIFVQKKLIVPYHNPFRLKNPVRCIWMEEKYVYLYYYCRDAHRK